MTFTLHWQNHFHASLTLKNYCVSSLEKVKQERRRCIKANKSWVTRVGPNWKKSYIKQLKSVTLRSSHLTSVGVHLIPAVSIFFLNWAHPTVKTVKNHSFFGNSKSTWLHLHKGLKNSSFKTLFWNFPLQKKLREELIWRNKFSAKRVINFEELSKQTNLDANALHNMDHMSLKLSHWSAL